MKKTVDPLRRLIMGAPLLLLAAACRRQQQPSTVSSAVLGSPVFVRVAADSAVVPLVQRLTQTWQRMHPAWFFAIESGNVAVVDQLVSARKADLAAVAYLPDDASLWATDLAIDGIAVVVNMKNPVESLSLAEVREIFAGYRHEWSSVVSTARGTVEVVVREDGEGTRLVFDRQVMGGTACKASAVVMPTPETALNYVALHPEAIAYVASGRFDRARQPLVKAIMLDGTSLAPATLADGSYVLSRNLHWVARTAPTGELHDFVEWTRSDEARRIAESLGYATGA